MHGNRVIRVFCVDGPYRGLQFLDRDTGRILREDDPSCMYRVSDHETTHTDFGPSATAYTCTANSCGVAGRAPSLAFD